MSSLFHVAGQVQTECLLLGDSHCRLGGAFGNVVIAVAITELVNGALL